MLKFAGIHKSINMLKLNLKKEQALNDAYSTALIRIGDILFEYCLTMFLLFYFVYCFTITVHNSQTWKSAIKFMIKK